MARIRSKDMKRSLLIIAITILITVTLVGVAGGRRSVALPARTVADLVVVEKSERKLTLFRDGRELKSYRVALGPNPDGHKQQEGDGRTPEGQYTIDFRKADSAFHRALHMSYPNAADIKSARERGVSPGGDIMIHGLPNGMGSLGSLHLFEIGRKGASP